MEWVNDWIGKQYQKGGRGPNYDCYGLVKAIYKEQLDKDLPEWELLNHNAKNKTLEFKKRIDEAESGRHAIEVFEPENFDLIVAYRVRCAHHIGLYLNGGVIHIGKDTRGCVFERLETFKKVSGKTRLFRWQ